MDTAKAGEMIAKALSLKTYEKIMQGLRHSETLEPTVETAEALVSNYFDDLLNFHFNGNFNEWESDLLQMIETSTIWQAIPSETKADRMELEELKGELSNAHTEGFLYGYITAMKDAERFFNNITDEMKNPTSKEAPMLAGNSHQ